MINRLKLATYSLAAVALAVVAMKPAGRKWL